MILLSGVLQPIAYALPTTYATDILRHQALGARLLLDPAADYVALVGTTIVALPIGRWAFRAADRPLRRLGTINQY